jgi:hypothetical protein
MFSQPGGSKKEKVPVELSPADREKRALAENLPVKVKFRRKDGDNAETTMTLRPERQQSLEEKIKWWRGMHPDLWVSEIIESRKDDRDPTSLAA